MDGVAWALGVGGKLKAGYTIHWNGNVTELLYLQQSTETATVLVHTLGQDSHG